MPSVSTHARRNLGGSRSGRVAPNTSSTVGQVPTATRSARPGWRDPRLLIGLALVAGCVVLGARLMAAADDTVGVLAPVRDLSAGTPLVRGDLEVHQVHFGSGEDAEAYLAADATLPDGATLAHDVGRDELLARTAIATGASSDLVEVPLGLAPEDLPSTVREGSRVDVWVAAKGVGVRPSGRAVRMLQDVAVLDLPHVADTLGPQSTRQVVVGVPAEEDDALARMLDAGSAGRIVITRRTAS